MSTTKGAAGFERHLAVYVSQHNSLLLFGVPGDQYLITARAMVAAGWPVIRDKNLRLVRVEDYVRYLEERAGATPKATADELAKRLGLVDVSNG